MTSSPATESGQSSGPALSRIMASLCAAFAVGFLTAGLLVYWKYAPLARDMVRVELTGYGGTQPLPPGTITTLWSDFALIGGYGLALCLGVLLARFLVQTPGARRAVRMGAVAGIVAVATDALADGLLLVVSAQPRLTSGWRDTLLDVAAVSEVLKFCLLIPAAAVAAWGVSMAVARAVINNKYALDRWARGEIEYHPPRPVEGDPDPAQGPGDSTPQPDRGVRWQAGFTMPPGENTSTAGGGPAVTGFCLSGGGIRAASVALGALQGLRARLLTAQHVVSVSGGGYTAGALVQALTAAEPQAGLGGQALRNPELAFAEGSAEEDHIRRHSSYLADTTPQLMLALGIILWNLVLSAIGLFAPAIVAGVLVGWFYRHVPIVAFGSDAATRFHFSTSALTRPAFLAVGLLILVAAALWLAGQRELARPPNKWSARLHTAARGAAWFAAITATLTIVLPVLVMAADWLLTRSWVRSVSIGGPVTGVVLTYLATLASIGWRRRTTIKAAAATGTRTARSVQAALPTGVTQRLLVVITLAVLGASWLLVFAAAVRTDGAPPALVSALVIGIVLIFIDGIADETTLSLHPFYRARLASAFAVRAVRRSSDEQIVAAGYRPDELTTLSRYGQVPNFPSVTFAAAANINGRNRTPPGRNGQSFTFNANWIGGPDVGWMRTSDMERLATHRLRRDLTVQGAVAISGAAFASAMGRGARWYQLLLAVSGARLGAWLPNPAELKAAVDRAKVGNWLAPRLPLTRRVSYLLRELFNTHPHTDRLIQVTDGGHYDNLGLVELLRRRCTTIYCIDASTDTPLTANALAHAICLAQDELGVTIRFNDNSIFDVEPGCAETLKPTSPIGSINPLDTLNARLSKTPVATGTITYPGESGLDGPGSDALIGTLVVAKAVLWPKLPYWLLSYAAKHPTFPHDATSDQWFDAAAFSAYTELGRALARHINQHVKDTENPRVDAAQPAAPQTPTTSAAPT